MVPDPALDPSIPIKDSDLAGRDPIIHLEMVPDPIIARDLDQTLPFKGFLIQTFDGDPGPTFFSCTGALILSRTLILLSIHTESDNLPCNMCAYVFNFL